MSDVKYMQAVCEDPSLPPDARVEQLGRLMDESHASCRDLYDCSCPELDRLVGLCKVGEGSKGGACEVETCTAESMHHQ